MFFRGFEEARSKELSEILGLFVRELSRHINLSDLDGLTIAYDYDQALLELDRGYETNYKLEATKGDAVGIAMTPAVIRDGKLKSHIILEAHVMLHLADASSDWFKTSLHTLAHECAHVEVTSVFDKAFPNVILRKITRNAHEHYRWESIKACWDEFAATWISASIGADPMAGYEETFITFLNTTRPNIIEKIKSYRLHGRHGQILGEVYIGYAELLKFACYLVGTMEGQEKSLETLPKTQSALEGSWFAPHFVEIQGICNDIRSNYGSWDSLAAFEKIADLTDRIVREAGLTIYENEDGQTGFSLPESPTA